MEQLPVAGGGGSGDAEVDADRLPRSLTLNDGLRMKLTCQRPARSRVIRAIPYGSGSGREQRNRTAPHRTSEP
jgi:hypothetical protein